MLLVVAAHVGLPGMAWAGQVGVAVFFTLSGFLITGILLRGQARTAFYMRRVARLLPALLVVLAAELAVTREPVHVAAALTYMSNWWAVAGGPPSPISHTWSLAVEEQFYLLWPALLATMTRRNRIATALVAVTAWRVIAWRIGWQEEVQWGTISNALGLLTGAWIAVRKPQPRPWMLPAGCAALSATVILAGGATPAVGFLVSVPAAIASTAAIITDSPQRTAPAVLCWFGTVSYGWYLWHQFLINTWGQHADLPGRAALAAAGLAAATASYYCLERPIIKQTSSGTAARQHASGQLTPR